MTTVTGNPLRIDLATAIVRSGYDNDDFDLFEWHHCEDTPNCQARTNQPCACSGVPYLSGAVWAQIEPVIGKVATEGIAYGARTFAEKIRAELAQLQRANEERGLYLAALAFGQAITSLDAAVEDLSQDDAGGKDPNA